MIVASLRPISASGLADAPCAPREVDAKLERSRDRAAADRDRHARRRRLIAVADALQRSRLRVGHEPIAIHRDGIHRTQVTEPLRVGTARRRLGEADQLERALNRRKKVAAARRHLFSGARDHLLGAGASGNQPDTHFDETHVGFARRLHAVAVEGNLTTAAKRETRRGDDDRDFRVPQSHCGLLKLPNDEVDVVPVLLLRFEEQQHEIRASGEVRRIVSDDEARRNCVPLRVRPPRSICSVSPPIAFILLWNSSASTPSPMSTRLAPAFFVTMRDWSFAFLRISQFRRRAPWCAAPQLGGTPPSSSVGLT